jgi:hypothetical protein
MPIDGFRRRFAHGGLQDHHALDRAIPSFAIRVSRVVGGRPS